MTGIYSRHIYRYIYIWYRLPVIVLNGANSIISVGLQPYASQGVISITTRTYAVVDRRGAPAMPIGAHKRKS